MVDFLAEGGRESQARAPGCRASREAFTHRYEQHPRQSQPRSLSHASSLDVRAFSMVSRRRLRSQYRARQWQVFVASPLCDEGFLLQQVNGKGSIGRRRYRCRIFDRQRTRYAELLQRQQGPGFFAIGFRSARHQLAGSMHVYAAMSHESHSLSCARPKDSPSCAASGRCQRAQSVHLAARFRPPGQSGTISRTLLQRRWPRPVTHSRPPIRASAATLRNLQAAAYRAAISAGTPD